VHQNQVTGGMQTKFLGRMLMASLSPHCSPPKKYSGSTYTCTDGGANCNRACGNGNILYIVISDHNSFLSFSKHFQPIISEPKILPPARHTPVVGQVVWVPPGGVTPGGWVCCSLEFCRYRLASITRLPGPQFVRVSRNKVHPLMQLTYDNNHVLCGI